MMIYIFTFITLINYAFAEDSKSNDANYANNTEQATAQTDANKSIEDKIADLRLDIARLEVEAAKSRQDSSDSKRPFIDPNFKAINDLRDKLRETIDEHQEDLKSLDFRRIESVIDCIMAVIFDDDKLSEDMRQETKELENIIPKTYESLHSLITLLRICHLAVTDEYSLFSRIEKMNHAAVIENTEAIDVLHRSLSWASIFCDDTMENVTNVIISIVAKASPEKGKNVPSFFLAKFIAIMKQQITKLRSELELVKREFDRRSKMIIDLAEKLAEDYAQQAKSQNNPEVVRPFFEADKKAFLSLSTIMQKAAREITDKMESVFQHSGKIVELLDEATELRMDTSVLFELGDN
jgi:hypothetical protein